MSSPNEWESDSDDDTLPQDGANVSDFNAVEPVRPEDIEPPVNSTAYKNKFDPDSSDDESEREQARALSVPKSPGSAMEKSVQESPPPPVPKKSFVPAAKKSSVFVKKPVARQASQPSPSVAAISNKPFAVGRAASRQPSVVRAPSANEGVVKADKRFEGKYPPEVVQFFSRMNKLSFTQQAVEYLNAYWDEVGDQAEFIFSVAIKIFREADMHRQGVSLYYKYEEGCDVDYPTYLYFYEKLVKFVTKNPKWKQGQYEKSAVYEVKTAIKHKNDLKAKVDVNFDGRVSFLEFLLFQYNVFSNPQGFMQRAMNHEEHPAVRDARLALEEVNQRIKAYEAERARLEEGAAKKGVKGLTFAHQLKMLDGSTIAEELNRALIIAEAAVRMAVKQFGGAAGVGATGSGAARGALWWMQRDLEEKKRVAVPKTLRRK